MKEKLVIVKIGGNLIDNKETLNKCLYTFSKISGNKILVHGGGSVASEYAQALGIQSTIVDGRRITDADMLDVIVMVYGGLISKKIVALLQSRNISAIGMSGADGDVIGAHKRIHPTMDYGMVGDIDYVNGRILQSLLSAKITPVLCPITHNGEGQLLNTNADTIASKVAIEMTKNYEVHLKYCFDYAGVMLDINKDTVPIKEINNQRSNKLKNKGILHSGLIPKIDNALHAKTHGVKTVCLCGINNLISEQNVTWII